MEYSGSVPTHVESIVLLSKLKSDKHIDVELEMDELDLTTAEMPARERGSYKGSISAFSHDLMAS